MTGRHSIVFAGCTKVLMADGEPLMQWVVVSAGFCLH